MTKIEEGNECRLDATQKSEKEKSISIFFPVYNDEATVEMLVRNVQEVLKNLTPDWEIILVDDCSQDDTGKIADSLASEDSRIKVIHHESNKGYGGALKSGFAAATKSLIFYTDGDGQYDVKELPLLMEHIDKADMVNGYKVKRGDRLYRKILGSIYHHVTKVMFGLKIRDVDCDFRLMRREIMDTIELESNSGVICVEMMSKIQGAGFSIVEVPVHHYPRIAGKSQFFRPKRILKVLIGLTIQWFKLIAFRGKWKYAKIESRAECEPSNRVPS